MERFTGFTPRFVSVIEIGTDRREHRVGSIFVKLVHTLYHVPDREGGWDTETVVDGIQVALLACFSGRAEKRNPVEQAADQHINSFDREG